MPTEKRRTRRRRTPGAAVWPARQSIPSWVMVTRTESAVRHGKPSFVTQRVPPESTPIRRK